MLLFLLLLLSGVLRTLTLSTTEDSIWSLSVTLLLVHLILSDHAEGHSIDTEVDVRFVFRRHDSAQPASEHNIQLSFCTLAQCCNFRLRGTGLSTRLECVGICAGAFRDRMVCFVSDHAKRSRGQRSLLSELASRISPTYLPAQRRHPGSALRPVVLTTSLSALALLVVLPLSAHSAIVYVLAVPLGATFGVPALWMYIQRYRKCARLGLLIYIVLMLVRAAANSRVRGTAPCLACSEDAARRLQLQSYTVGLS